MALPSAPLTPLTHTRHSHTCPFTPVTCGATQILPRGHVPTTGSAVSHTQGQALPRWPGLSDPTTRVHKGSATSAQLGTAPRATPALQLLVGRAELPPSPTVLTQGLPPNACTLAPSQNGPHATGVYGWTAGMVPTVLQGTGQPRQRGRASPNVRLPEPENLRSADSAGGLNFHIHMCLHIYMFTYIEILLRSRLPGLWEPLQDKQPCFLNKYTLTKQRGRGRDRDKEIGRRERETEAERKKWRRNLYIKLGVWD